MTNRHWNLYWAIIGRRADTLAQRHALLLGMLIGAIPYAAVYLLT